VAAETRGMDRGEWVIYLHERIDEDRFLAALGMTVGPPTSFSLLTTDY
jgi:hypothetical protein